MIKRLLVAVLMAFSGASLLLAEKGDVTVLNHKEGEFTNTDCKKNNTCDLRKIEYTAEDYKVETKEGFNYGTRFFARYETKKVEDLEKYLFVQFIKGCDYSSTLNEGEPLVILDQRYPRDNSSVLFKFDDWTIDSDTHDPAYSSFSNISRFYGNRWNKVQDSFSAETEVLYGRKKPDTPKLYIVDHPGQAFYYGGVAHNLSLQFKTCMYKAEDVPENVEYENTNFAEPISCYEWGSSFVYNHSTNQFDSYPEVVSDCR